MTKKPVFNYDIQICNLLFKKGVNPIGCAVNERTNQVYHVFIPSKKYFEMLKLISYEMAENNVK